MPFYTKENDPNISPVDLRKNNQVKKNLVMGAGVNELNPPKAGEGICEDHASEQVPSCE